jgi:proline iminopeptidase
VPFFHATDGTRLHYTEQGEGPLLICHPGGPGRAAAYLEDLGGLARTRRLVALDSRGSGASAYPDDPGTMGFTQLAEDVVALLEHLEVQRSDILGHSAGAIVVQVLLARHPHRCAKVVLVTPSSRLQAYDFPDLPAVHATRSAEPWYDAAAQAQEAWVSGVQTRDVTQLIRPLWYGAWGPRQQEHAESATEQTSRRAEVGFPVPGFDRPGLLAELAVLEHPVLVIAGDKDGMTGVVSAERVAASFAGGRVGVITDAGHYPWVDQPVVFASLVDAFLG